MPLPGEVVHVVGIYDGETASLYLDGHLVSEASPCGEAVPCGGVRNPSNGDAFYAQGAKAAVTLGVVRNGRRGTDELHRGAMRMVRIMKEAMSPLEVLAGSGRFAYDLSSDPCLPGSFGPYEGRKPCLPCPRGTAQHIQGASFCTACPLGMFAAREGQQECEACPPGTAPVPGGDACSADPCAQVGGVPPAPCGAAHHDGHAARL